MGVYGVAGEARSPIKAKRGLDRLEISRIWANGASYSYGRSLYSRHMPSMHKNTPTSVTGGCGRNRFLLVTQLLERN